MVKLLRIDHNKIYLFIYLFIYINKRLQIKEEKKRTKICYIKPPIDYLLHQFRMQKDNI